MDVILVVMINKYKNEDILIIDGVKIDFVIEWVYLRKLNIEFIICIYIEVFF